MRIFCTFMAIVVTISFCGMLARANIVSLAVVNEANGAHLNTTAVSVGTNIYDGDRLSTEANGALRLASTTFALRLFKQSKVIMKYVPGPKPQTVAELLLGMANFQVNAGASPIELRVCAARIHSMTEGAAFITVGIIGPKELVLSVHRGSFQLSYQEQSVTFAKGETVRVLLGPAENASGSSSGANIKIKGSRSPDLKILVTTIGAGGLAAGMIPMATSAAASTQMNESPENP